MYEYLCFALFPKIFSADPTVNPNPVEASDRKGLSRGAAAHGRELLLGGVVIVVKLLEHDSIMRVHDDLLVAAGGHDVVGGPAERVGRNRMLQHLSLTLGVGVVGHVPPNDMTVCVAREEPCSVEVGSQGDHAGVGLLRCIQLILQTLSYSEDFQRVLIGKIH